MIDRFRPSIPLRILQALFVVVALLVSADLIRRSLPMYLPRDWSAAHEHDALVDWKAARLYREGKNPYSPEGLAAIGETAMGHPPTTPFWYLILADSPKAVVAEVSTLLFWTLIPSIIFLCVNALNVPMGVATAALITTATFNLTLVKYHSDAIQFSGAIAFLYVLAWRFLRRGRDLGAGICLGAALTMKLFPGVMLVMLLLGRRFRAFLAAVATYLAVAALMTRTYGLTSWVQFLQQQGPVSDEWLGNIMNASLPGLVVRLATPACEGQGHPSLRTSLIATGCSVALLFAAGWLSHRHLRRADDHGAADIDVPFALFALLSGFLNAWAWDHYFVLTIQPLIVLTATFLRTWFSTFRRWCDGDESNGRVVATAALVLVALAGVALTVRAQMVDSHQRNDIAALWFQHRDPFYHRMMHWLEAANFAGWIIPILLCYAALIHRSGLRWATENGPRRVDLDPATPYKPPT